MSDNGTINLFIFYTVKTAVSLYVTILEKRILVAQKLKQICKCLKCQL